MSNCRIGIDVGGTKKGFHIAIVHYGEPTVAALLHAKSPGEIVRALEERALAPDVVAIDCPPRCTRHRQETRLAERQLHRMGYRMQWTRHESQDAAEWMRNGQRLWEALREHFPEATLIECFPTAAGSALETSPLIVPLALLAPHRERREWKDFVDACLCADVANRYGNGVRSAGRDEVTGEADEMGPIYF